MPSSRRPSDADVDPNNDPYAGPTSWRSADRTGTQPLDDIDPNATVGLPGDGTDWAARRGQRQQRRRNARVYPSNIGQMAQRVNNRQIFIIGGILIVLLVALLVWRNYHNPDNGTTTDSPLSPTALTDPNATPGPLFIDQTPGPSGTSSVPIEVAPPSSTTQAPASGGGASLVVTGTGSEGLFLRADPNSNGTVVTTLPEGTKVESTGDEQNDGTRTWKKVKTADGQEGWVAGDFVTPAP